MKRVYISDRCANNHNSALWFKFLRSIFGLFLWVLEQCCPPFSRLAVNNLLFFTDGHAMDGAVNRRLLTAVTRIWPEAHLCGVCGGQGDIGSVFFSPSISVFPCQYQSTNALYVTYIRPPWMLCNLLLWRYNSGRVLAFSTISLHLRRSWTCSAHLISFIFFSIHSWHHLPIETWAFLLIFLWMVSICVLF